jgi:hypothetical protein
MIITAKDTTGLVTNNLGNDSRKLGIKASGWAHLSTILRDSLYSDKILAPIREYSTNAMDAHVEAGKPKRPILVKLPNSLVPTFAVRDYGFGMSEDRIWEVFANYGESTKRNSNEQTGMLGIGSKSAFAYTDNFTIVNYHRGIKSIFMCHVAGSAEGDLVRVSQEVTTEEDGLEIQIPVAAKDITTWIKKAQDFFRYWTVIPEFEGNTVDIQKIETLFDGDGWYITKDQDSPKILMGNICYPIDAYQVDQSLYRLYNNTGIVLKASIGDVDIAASREGLQYTERTKAYLSKRGTLISDEFQKTIQSEIDACKTNFEKQKLVTRYSDYYSKYYRFNFLTAKILSNLGGGRFVINQIDVAQIFTVNFYSKSRRGARKVRPMNFGVSSIECRDDFRYVSIKNTDKHYLNRIAALIERAPSSSLVKGVYTIEVLNQAKFDVWKKNAGFDIPLTPFDTLPVVKTSELYGSTQRKSYSYSYNPKSGKKVFLVDRSVNSKVGSDYFTPTVVNNNEKNVPYVVIENWLIGACFPTEFVTMIGALENILNIKIPKIVAVRPSGVAKLGSQFISFESYLDQLFSNKKHLEDLNNFMKMQQLKDISIGNRYDGEGYIDCGSFCNLFANLNGYKVDADSLFMKLKQILCDNKSYKNVNYLKKFTKKYVSDKDMNDHRIMVTSLFDQFIKRYPLLGLIDHYGISRGGVKNSILKYMIDYVNFVDGREKLVVG